MKKIIFLVAIITIAMFNLISCSNENDEITNSKSKNDLNNISFKENSLLNRDLYNKKNVETFVHNHIIISDKIVDLLKNELQSSFDTKLLNVPENINNDSELKEYFKSCNIKEYESLVLLIKDLSNNSENFYNSNKEFYSLDKNLRIQIIENEINNQLDSYTFKTDAGTDKCFDQYKINTDRCARNYYIGTGLSVASGFISFGWSTVIGYTAVQATLITCLYDAEVDYKACLK
jgi:hypothetical protein